MRRYLAFPPFSPCMQCFSVSIPRAVRPTLLRQMVMGSLTCTYIWLRAVHTMGGGGEGGGGGGAGTNDYKSAKELTRRDRKNCSARGSNPGSSDLNSDALTTESRPPIDDKKSKLSPQLNLCL